MQAGQDPPAPTRGPPPQHWHVLSAERVVEAMVADANAGLDDATAAARQATHGRNEIRTASRFELLKIITAQFSDFMIMVLLGAALISGLVGEARDAIAIVIIVVLNALIGVIQQYRAQRALASLRSMAAPTARVLRQGRVAKIPSIDVVPGDILLLESGDVVPADARLLDVDSLQIDESALTGESRSVAKAIAPLDTAELPLGDRHNMVYRDTLVTRGNARAVVVATGSATEIGHIADLIGARAETDTPLQIRIARFGRHLALAIIVICAVIFGVGILQGQAPMLMFLTAVSLAVAAVPEALPAVVTISLALGARRLARHSALLRHLPAVEALGSVTFICADKTGTLTQNRMAFGAAVAADTRVDTLPSSHEADPLWSQLGQAMALNSDAELGVAGAERGDPTELALLRAAAAAGFQPEELLEALPRIATLPFDESRRRMGTLHQSGSRTLLYVKGAPEATLGQCRQQLTAHGPVEFDPAEAGKLAETLAGEGYRVLAFAYREFDAQPDPADADRIESDLILLGLVGLIDPPRPEARQAVSDCIQAGITPVMITGDHPETARHIAMALGIADQASDLLTGPELDRLDASELEQRIRDIRVYARVNPEQKIRIVDALTAAGEFTAMTGDGVNDAPALKAAAIGIAMGKRGTDVARESADMVLLDDNFATIVAAVREGRRIFDDIRKFIKYTMTSNAGEIWTLFLAPFLGLPLPLLPIQILWVNLLTDGLPGLAFAAEPAEADVMRRPPRPPQENIFSRPMWLYMLWMGLTIAALALSGQAWALHHDAAHWQTMVFTILVFAQLFHALGVRANRTSLWQLGLASNPQLLLALIAMVALQLAAIYLPWFNEVLRTQALPPFDLAMCFGIASLALVAVEIQKAFARRALARRTEARPHD
jgi:Ca2+-transporting ATPase